MKKIGIVVFLVLLCLSTTVFARAKTTLLADNFTQGNINGVIPFADGITDEKVQSNINKILRDKSEALAKGLGGNVTLSYTQQLDQPSIFSVLLVADNGSEQKVQGVNIDVTSGKEAVLGDFLYLNDTFKAVVGEYKDLVLGQDGITVSKTTEGVYDEFIPYKSLIKSINIATAGRFLPVFKITKEVAGKTLYTKAGDIIALKLDSNRTTGYSWLLSEDSRQQGVVEMGSSFVMQSATNPNMTGVAGIDIILFACDKAGEYNVSYQYKRPWEKDINQELNFKVVVE